MLYVVIAGVFILGYMAIAFEHNILTTSIVMVSLLSKIIDDQKMRWYFAGLIVIAPNAGGARSPVGDGIASM